MKSPQNRFLLAYEVGMGKTIEAGLILKELKLRSDIKPNGMYLIRIETENGVVVRKIQKGN